MRWLSRFITFAVIVAAAMGLVLFARSRLPATTVGQQFVTWAKFRDASKLVIGSPVVIAGVRIGEVTNLTIEGQLARVDMRLRDDTDIAVDSFVQKRAPSTFGDSYVEIIPAGGDIGASIARKLQSGEPLTHVVEGSSTDTVLRATARSMPRLEQALDTLAAFMVQGRSWVNGAIVGTLQSADTWLEQGHVHQPLAKVDDALERFEHATERATAALGGPDKPMQSLTRFDEAIADARKKMRDYRGAVVEGFAQARTGLDGIDEPIAQARDAVAAIAHPEGDDWQGTLGRLVNDPSVGESIADGVDGLAEATASFNRFRAYLGTRFEMNLGSRLPRVYLTAQIRARNDKFYLIELQKGLLGGVPADRLTDAAGTDAYTRTQEIKDELRFTLQFGKIFGPLTVRGGIKDSTFGMGADFMSGRLLMSGDIFGSYDKTPNLKFTLAYMIFRSVYVIAGIDDALNEPGTLDVAYGNSDVPQQFRTMRYGRDYFLGGQLRFSDEDIATLLRVYGAVLAGVL